jgi:hypothetical protein
MGGLGGAGDADHAAGRAGDHGVAAAEGLGADQAAGRGHEVERRALDRGGHPLHVGLQDGRQIGVGDGGLGARDEAGQGRDLVAERHECEAGVAGDLAGGDLVLRAQVGVQEGDGGGGEALAGGRLQGFRQPRAVQGNNHAPFGV